MPAYSGWQICLARIAWAVRTTSVATARASTAVSPKPMIL